MKSNKSFRVGVADSGDLRRGTKLSPIKKSGKERHSLYSELDDEDTDYGVMSGKESIFDYMDDDDES